MRKIIHIDMDAFFASVEQRDNPELRGKPVAVGGNKQRGVVAAASYEARAFGVFSAMPSVTAARKCPDLIFVRPRFEVYKEVSRQIHQIFEEYTDLIEPLSLDEAYLDVTENKKGMPYAKDIALEIKEKIFQKTRLTASAGISYNKFLAKTASDVKKPNGLYIIYPHKAEAFLEQLPVKKFYGIGKVTAEKLNGMGIFTGKDLKSYSREHLHRWFGKSGEFYYRIVRGEDERQVHAHRTRKSIGAERTYAENIETKEAVYEALVPLAQEVSRRTQKSRLKGKTLTLKIKFHDFEIASRSKTFVQAFDDEAGILLGAKELAQQIPRQPFSIRLLGLSLHNLSDEAQEGQLRLELT
ncbi:DNA polymerase IV [Shiella aurantiaca]|nr:DNA polymerase IV [Shiella aurantiaca]